MNPHVTPPSRRPMQPLVCDLGLARMRVHEFCGPARHALAALLLAQTAGPVLWVSPGWQAERVFPEGLAAFADPGRLIFAQARRPEDVLWSAEEALRSGAVGLVLADLATVPGLTPVRRLHLAAEAGAEIARHRSRPAPLGVLLTAGEGGAAGVESRWSLTVLPTEAGTTARRWRLDLLRARMEPPRAWALHRDAEGRMTLTTHAELIPA